MHNLPSVLVYNGYKQNKRNVVGHSFKRTDHNECVLELSVSLWATITNEQILQNVMIQFQIGFSNKKQTIHKPFERKLLRYDSE